MTIIWFDGFEAKDADLQYEVYNLSTQAWPSTTRYSYGVAIHGNTASEQGLGKNFTAATDVYVGVAKNLPGNTARQVVQFFGDTGATQHITVMVNASNQVEVRRGTSAGTVIATSTLTLPSSGGWSYFEVHVKVADSGGVADVKVDGTSYVTFSGDTKNAGTNTTVDRVVWVTSSNGYIDDVYLCNGLGSVNNTFLGERRVYYSVPTGAGNSTQLTASTGSNWQTVDEAPPSSTDYSGHATVGNKDTYAMTDLPSTPTAINAVRVGSEMHKSDAGAASMRVILRVTGTDYTGTTRTLSASMVGYSDIWESSPATSTTWTTSEVNAAEIGAQVQ